MMTRGTVWFIGVAGVIALTGATAMLKAGPIEQRIAQNAADEIKRLGLDRRVDMLIVDANGRDVTLSGTALSESDRIAVLAAAEAASGVRSVTSAITIAPEAKPFVFRASRNADGVTLIGAAPGPEVADALGVLGRRLFGSQVKASIGAARGAPRGDWSAAARAAIEVLAFLQEGEAVLTGSVLSIRGRALDDAALDAAAASLARGVPPGFQASHDLYTALDEDLRREPLAAAAPCQALIGRVMAGQPIAFAPGSAALGETKGQLIPRLAQAARRCSALYLHVSAAGDGGDPASATRLGQARAEALTDALAQNGVPRERMTVAGRAEPDPRPRLTFSASAVPLIHPYVWRIEKSADGRAVMSGHHPSAETARTLTAFARPALGGALEDETRAGEGAPSGDWLGAARLGIEAVAGLDHGAAILSGTDLHVRGIAKDDVSAAALRARVNRGLPQGFRARFDLTVAIDQAIEEPATTSPVRCQELLDRISQTEPVSLAFDGAALHALQRRFFERAAAVLARCPDAAIEIGAHSTGSGDSDAALALSDRWARAVADSLVLAGIARKRLRSVGYGNAQPIADAATEDGRQRNRRIALRIVNQGPGE